MKKYVIYFSCFLALFALLFLLKYKDAELTSIKPFVESINIEPIYNKEGDFVYNRIKGPSYINLANNNITLSDEDGEIVDGKYYEAKSGSTDITIKPGYLYMLSPGKHNYTIKSIDGKAGGTFEVIVAQSNNENLNDNKEYSDEDAKHNVNNNSDNELNEKINKNTDNDSKDNVENKSNNLLKIKFFLLKGRNYEL